MINVLNCQSPFSLCILKCVIGNLCKMKFYNQLVVCKLIVHTYIHTYIATYIHIFHSILDSIMLHRVSLIDRIEYGLECRME